MSLEDTVRRKLQEQKKEKEKEEQERLKETVIQALRDQKAGKQVNTQTAAQQTSGLFGLDFLQAGALKNIDLGSAFKDGYQFGDVAKTYVSTGKEIAQTILGSQLDVTFNMWKGIGGVAEGLVDLGMYGVSGIQKATGHTEAAEKTKQAARADFVGDTLLGEALDYVSGSSVLGNTSKSIASGIGQGAVSLGLGMLTGGLGTAASTAITTGATGLSSMGHGMTEAYEGNATDGEAALYGLISGVVDAGTELLSGGLGKGAKAIGVGKGIGGVDDMIASGLTKNITNKFAKNLAQMGVKAAGEGVEEALSYAGQTLAKKWTYLSEKELKELWSNQELLENFVVGTMTSAFMQAGDTAKATKAGQDFVSGRTDAEQTVIDKLYKDRVAEQEKDGKKLSTKEKGKILDAVELEYERGEIDVEDIEAALGGDSYQKYTEMAKQQKDLRAEFDQLNGIKKSDMTGAQEDRLQELRQQLATMKQEDTAGKLKEQYLQETMAKVTGSHLEESYNQYNRRSEYFRADLKQYGEKQRAIVQKAVDSGILNDTRKTHDFVDLVAKVAADTGVDFDFTDNKKLAESGFAVDGMTVNGFTDGKTVTVNIHSAKALNTVVGHEIMHVLEGTELAGKLQKQLFAYAESKGELAKRRGDLEKLYAGRSASIDSELAADLVGDYIFSDIDFVRSLKAGDRNLFQRIYDEIKHLVKLATAGSKEARELEKAKKLFADVYREAGAEKSTADDGGVQHSFSKKSDSDTENKHLYMKPFADQLADYQNGNITGDDALVVGSTPDVLKTIGLIGLPMTINQKHVGDALNGTYKGTQQEKLDHTFTAKELATLPEKLAEPVAIIHDKRAGKVNASESTIDVLVEMTVASGKQVLAAVQVNGSGRISGIRSDTNRVSTVHGNTDSVTRLIDAINENQKGSVAVFYINKEKTTKVLQRTGNPIPSGLSNLDGFIHSIADPGSPVKMRITSVTESQQFKRWFGDWQNHPENASKIVNANGTPKVMYHGSPAQFSVFDKKKAKGSGMYGRGFYFTDSAEQAAVYGNRYSVYLDVKHPLQSGGEQVSRAQVRRFLEAVAENEDYSIENYGTYHVEQVLQTVMGSQKNVDAFKIIQDINATAIGDMVEAAGLFNEINGTAFDGIVVPTETVVFRPEQVKSATDNVGTFDGSNPDIRYSLSAAEADKQYMAAVEHADMGTAQRMVDEAARRAGFPEKLYHGTMRGFGFTKIDPNKAYDKMSFFATDSPEVASTYSGDDGVMNISLAQELGLTAGNYQLYANTDGFVEIDAKGSRWDEIRLNQAEQAAMNRGVENNIFEHINHVTNTNDLARYAKRRGYPGVKVTNVYDQAWILGSDFSQKKPATVYIFLDPQAQVRSADPVTYDDNGNVIPLSERFNPQSGDLRESLSASGAQAGYDPKQIYGRDVAFEAPVADRTGTAQVETGMAGIEGPLPEQMPKAQPIEGPLREDLQTEKPLPENFEAKAPKEGMQPVVSPVVNASKKDKRKRPKREEMSPEEQAYYEESGEKPVTTFQGLMETKIENLQKEIAENKENRRKSAAQYDEKIRQLQEEYNGLKKKNTKRAEKLLRSISEQQRKKADEQARYNLQIHNLEKSIRRHRERIKADTGRTDWLESKTEAIDKRYEEDLEAMRQRHAEEHEALTNIVTDKDQFVKEKALGLYDELTRLKKGVKASPELGYLLDKGYTWNAIKSALLLVEQKPSGIANPHFELEKVAREHLDRLYQNAIDDLNNLNQQQAQELEQLENDMEEEKSALKASQIKKDKMEQYEAEAEILAGYTGGWKDKKTGLGYAMSTMRRYFREVVRDENGNPDIERADAITDYLQGTYNRNEAALKLEARKRKDRIRELGLNEYEDEYGAMLGELKYNPESQEDANLAYVAEEFLEAHRDKIDLEKVNKAIELLRGEYDELHVLINQTLREQGFKEIPYRKGYFPHFTERSQTWIQKLLNWKPNNDEIPTDIAGKTEEFKPQRSYQRFNKERKSNVTVYSLQKGYDNYLNGALDWIYHIADIQRRRAFENYLRYIHTDAATQAKIDEIKDSPEYTAEEAQMEIDKVIGEYKNRLNNLVVELRRGTNTLAAKKSSLDREIMEGYLGRPSYSVLTNITSRASANQVAGNLASAATNIIPIIQSSAELRNPVWTLNGIAETLAAIENDDGMVEKSTFLTNRLRPNEPLYRETWDKIGDVISVPMEAMDNFASQVVWRSKYLKNKHDGMTEAEAITIADQFAENVIAGRSRGNMPTIFDSKNPFIKLITTFQLEPANEMGYFFKDLPLEAKKEATAEKAKNGGRIPVKTAAKLAVGVTEVLVGSYAYNLAMKWLTGNTPATDPVGMIENIIRDAWGEIEDDDEEEPGEEIASVAVNTIEELAQALPYIGGLLGGGRISSAAALPYDNVLKTVTGTATDIGEGNWKNLIKEWSKLIYYGVLPMGGGQIKKINEGIGMYLDPNEKFPILPKAAETPGSYTTSGNLRYAVEPTAWNVIQSLLFGQYANENARDYFDEGRSPLTPGQVEEFNSVDMDMQEYWDYRDALKAAGDSVADKIDVVMDLDLPISQKNVLANNIAKRKNPIDLTKAGMFEDFAELDFFTQHREKYDFLKKNGISVKQYLTMEDAADALEKYQPESEEMQKFLEENGLTMAECERLKEEKEILDFRHSNEKKYDFLTDQGIGVQEYMAMGEEEKEEVDMLYENPDKYKFLQKAGISVAEYKGFDSTTKKVWDWAADNPKKYEFLQKQGISMDQYKMFNDGWKKAWNWAYKDQDGYLLSKGVTNDLYTYRKYMDKMAGISGDKNEKGNTVNGSKQKKVWAYIQTLPLSDGAKLLLFKEKYPDDDTYNKEVAQYVLSLNMTYAEKKRILERLKFKIGSSGKITW